MDGLCANALAAAIFDVLLVRPSRSTLDAADAAASDVTFLGAFVCESVLPAAVFDFGAVLPLFNVFAALDAAFGPVTPDFTFDISISFFS